MNRAWARIGVGLLALLMALPASAGSSSAEDEGPPSAYAQVDGVTYYMAAGLVNGSALTLGLVFERWRYKPVQTPSSAKGSPTGERFIDPETGVLMEVYYDAATGERTYVRAVGSLKG